MNIRYNKFYYNPLPDYFSIRKSDIHGHGIFATEIENWTRYDYQQQCDLLVKLRKRKFLNTGKIRRKNRRNIL